MFIARCLVVVAAALAAFPAAASARTWNVSPTGTNLGPGSQELPFRTISRAASVARSGDTVLVAPGRYRETVALGSRASGVVFRGTGDSRPVIDGEGGRDYGFRNAGASRVRIENFEFTGQTDAAVHTIGSQVEVIGNLMHHIGSSGETESNGVRVIRGWGNVVSGNTIHHVGPGRLSTGIYLLEARNAWIENNTVYLVRKEGIRDWKGLDNTIIGNRTLLCWAGIALNTSTGSLVTDNRVEKNVEGIAVKHASYRTVLDHWDLEAPHWSRVLHNTIRQSSEASIWIAQSHEPLDYLEVSNNLIAGAGGAYLRDRPELRGSHVKVDANRYSSAGREPRWLYKAGYTSGEGEVTNWDAVTRRTGWEAHEPPADAGARGTAPAEVTWASYPMRAVHSSSRGTWWTKEHLDKTSDGDQTTYWLTEGNSNEFVVFDLGYARTFNHLLLTLYTNDDLRTPRGYQFAVSDNGTDWRTIHSGNNGDTSGAARYYELPKAVTARYLRYTMVDTFCSNYLPRLGCGEYFVVSDLEVGFLEPNGAPAPVEPAVAVAPDARVTRAGKLRVEFSCVGDVRGKARFAVVARRAGARRNVRLGRKRAAIRPSCARTIEIPLRPRLLKRLRAGRLDALRVTAAAPGGDPVTTWLNVRL